MSKKDKKNHSHSPMPYKSVLQGAYFRTKFPVIARADKLPYGKEGRYNTIFMPGDYSHGPAAQPAGKTAIRQHLLQETLQETS